MLCICVKSRRAALAQGVAHKHTQSDHQCCDIISDLPHDEVHLQCIHIPGKNQPISPKALLNQLLLLDAGFMQKDPNLANYV